LTHAIYRLHQSAYSAWAQRRYREAFDGVRTFALFVGYPRSGHSLVGAFLNAHEKAVISHELDAPQWILAGCSREELYARILARAYWFNLRGNRSNHDYQVPGQWQGRFAELRVIGDKRAGSVTRAIAANPGFVAHLRALVGIPIRLIHVIRNPFDNISAISIWHQLTLEEAIDYYFMHCRTTMKLADCCEADELVALRHEDLIAKPEPVLRSVCGALGLQAESSYLESCRRVLFGEPTHTRRKLAWTPAAIHDVERRMREVRFLDGYEFALTRQ
jgi:hypothetical protein